MNENELKALVNEYLMNCCDDITDFARDWCAEEKVDMSDDDVDKFAQMVEDEVRIWVLLGRPQKEKDDDGTSAELQ